jgi:GDP-L-fucose synthase
MSVEFSADDRILVTGATGMLGGAIARILRETTAAHVLAPARIELDLIDSQSVRRYFEEARPTHVFHPAAKVFGLGGNTRFPGQMYFENAIMNANVIDAARVTGTRKISGVGTGCVYPVMYDGQFLDEKQIWDGPPHGSEWAYAQAKRGMLTQLSAYQQQYGLDYVFPICGNLYGPNDLFNVEYGHVIPSLIAKFHLAQQQNEPVTVWGTGIAVRDFSFVDDAAQAIIAAHKSLSGPVNVASGNIHSIRDVVEILDDLTNSSLEIRWDSSKPDGQGRRFYSLEKLGSSGFSPTYSLKDGLEATWNWYQSNYPNVRT